MERGLSGCSEDFNHSFPNSHIPKFPNSHLNSVPVYLSEFSRTLYFKLKINSESETILIFFLNDQPSEIGATINDFSGFISSIEL